MNFLYHIFDKNNAKIFNTKFIFLVTMAYYEVRYCVIHGTVLKLLY